MENSRTLAVKARGARAIVNAVDSIRLHIDPSVGMAIAGVFLIRGYQRLSMPQMWAEDGARWYADAFNNGLGHTIFVPYNGYLHIIPRLTGWLASLLSPISAAIFMSVTSVMLVVIFCWMIWMRRSEIGTRSALVLVALIILSPYTQEIYGNITNIMWYGTMTQVVLCVAAITTRLRWYEYMMALALGLSGPHALVIGAAMIAGRTMRGYRYDSIYSGIIGCCCVINLYIMSTSGRQPSLVNYKLSDAPIIIGKQIVAGGIFGLQRLIEIGPRVPMIVWFVFGCVWLLLICFGVITGDATRFMICLTAAMLVVLTLMFPLISDDTVSLRVMLTPMAGSRYWFFPAVVLKLEILRPVLKMNSVWPKVVLIGALVAGARTDYIVSGYPNRGFIEGAREFERHQVGDSISIPIYPPGWKIELIRR